MDRQGISTNPTTIPQPPTQQDSQNFQPHRGTMILIFGILGVSCCFPFGIAAWVMGHADMKLIDSGEMDPTGRGMTNGGKICGIISVILTVIGCGLNLIPVLFELSHR